MVTDHIILSLKRQIDDSSFLSQESGVSHFIITKKRSWDRAKQWSQCKCSDFDGDSPFPQRQISQPGVNCLRKEYTWLWNPNRRSIKNPPSGFSQLPVALAPPKREKKKFIFLLMAHNYWGSFNLPFLTLCSSANQWRKRRGGRDPLDALLYTKYLQSVPSIIYNLQSGDES